MTASTATALPTHRAAMRDAAATVLADAAAPRHRAGAHAAPITAELRAMAPAAGADPRDARIAELEAALNRANDRVQSRTEVARRQLERAAELENRLATSRALVDEVRRSNDTLADAACREQDRAQELEAALHRANERTRVARDAFTEVDAERRDLQARLSDIEAILGR